MIEFDDREFQERMKKIAYEQFPARMEKALGVAAMALLRDCLMVAPTVPLQEGGGWLRGSGSVHVNGVFKEESPEGQRGFANKGKTGVESKNTAVVGFNTPYASYLHEGQRKDGTRKVVNWSEPSSGSKFMESKMSMFSKQYGKLMAETIKG